MKKLIFVICSFVLSGCATNQNYQTYVNAQIAISKDQTLAETARIAALVEMTKSPDPAIRATGIMLLQQLQQSNKITNIEPPKKGIFSF